VYSAQLRSRSALLRNDSAQRHQPANIGVIQRVEGDGHLSKAQ
jgi:hypothetical protein